MEEKEGQGSVKFQCPHCARVCTSTRGLTQHINSAHTGVQLEGASSSDDSAVVQEPAVAGGTRRKRGKGSVLMPPPKKQMSEPLQAAEVAKPTTKIKKTQVSMRPKRRGLYKESGETEKCGDGNSSDNEEQTSGDKSADDEVNTSAQSTNDAMEFEDEGTHVEKEINVHKESCNDDKTDEDETKLLLHYARAAISNEEITSGDDIVILDMLLDEEHGSGLLEDIVIPLKSSESLILEADANQSDNEIEEIMSDLAFDDMTIIKREEIPDQDQNLVMGLDQDFIISEESEEDPYRTDPIVINEPRDPDSWQFEVAMELAGRVSEDWNVYMSEGAVRLVLISPFENVSVERSVNWDGKEAKVFIHNREIPQNCFIRSVPVPEDETEICDYLVRIAHLVYSSSICQGVRIYEDEWTRSLEQDEGFKEPEFYQNVQCFRDKECLLLETDSEICNPCRSRKAVFKSRNFRRKHPGKDQEKKNVRYMSNAEKTEKLKTLVQKNRELRKKAYNLKLSLEKYVQKGSVEVDAELGKDLARVFKENTLTKTQRLFWGEQIKAQARSGDLRGMRWNPFIIRLALRIQMLAGKEAYDALRQVIYLPSQRRLYDFTHFTEAKEGIQEEILKEIAKEAEEKYKEDYEKYFSLIFDEMDISSDIVISRKTGDVIGFLNLFPVEAEMAKLEKEMMEGKDFEPPPAQKVLVFMIQGLCNPMQEVVSVYTSSGALTASQLYTRFWHTAYSCENLNLKILAGIADGAPINKKFFNLHSPFEEPYWWSPDEHSPKEKNFIYCTRNIAAADEWRPLFFLVDPPHLLKSLRNCFANSYAHKKTRFLWKNGHDISWSTIEALYAIILKVKYNGTKLTKSHVKLTSHSCMKVVFAAQVMSDSVVNALDHFKQHAKLKQGYIGELKKMIKIVNDWFDCHNGGKEESSTRTQENPFLKKYESVNDSRFNFLTETVLKYFEDWKEDTIRRPGNFSAEEREKMFISHQSFESLKITIYGFVGLVKFLLRAGAPFVIARRCNSDPIEQYFARLRMAFGCNRNPSAKQVTQKVLTLYQQKGVSLSSKKGNTQLSSKEYEPNEEKLRQRKK